MSVTGHVTPFVIQRGARINMYGSKDSSSAACGVGVGEKDSSEVTEWGATEVTLDLDRLMYPKKSNGKKGKNPVFQRRFSERIKKKKCLDEDQDKPSNSTEVTLDLDGLMSPKKSNGKKRKNPVFQRRFSERIKKKKCLDEDQDKPSTSTNCPSAQAVAPDSCAIPKHSPIFKAFVLGETQNESVGAEPHHSSDCFTLSRLSGDRVALVESVSSVSDSDIDLPRISLKAKENIESKSSVVFVFLF